MIELRRVDPGFAAHLATLWSMTFEEASPPYPFSPRPYGL